MKWLKSTTQKAWTVGAGDKQYIVPPNETSDNRFLSMDDSEYAEMVKSPVIASLVKTGSIMVLDQEPAELKNSVPALQVTNTHLQAELDTAKARITELEGQLKNVSSIDIEAIKAEVRAQCEAEKQKALEELDAKASTIIGEKDETIAKLEKKIKKLSNND